MIIIKGQSLDTAEKKMIRHFCMHTLAFFVTPKKLKNKVIVINIVNPKTLTGVDKKELITFKAWMNQSKTNKHKFLITINAKTIDMKNKHLFVHKFQYFLQCLCHELVHVKQYINKETSDCSNGDVFYKGTRYTNWQDGVNYWLAPWELEARMYEETLVETFKIKLNNSSVV
jgi:hypothetical protein